MSADNRNNAKPDQEQDKIEDLPATGISEKSADQVTGGMKVNGATRPVTPQTPATID
jgi:hypothetical protein